MKKQFLKLGINLLIMISIFMISCSDSETIESSQIEVENSSPFLNEFKSMEFPPELKERISDYRNRLGDKSEFSDKEKGTKNIYLNVPNDYATIQEAIDASESGDVINVEDGNYWEHVIVHVEGLTLQGSGKNVNIYGTIGVVNNDVSVTNFNVIETEIEADYMPVLIYSLGYVEWGAYLEGIRISNNRIRGKSIADTQTVGIWFHHTRNCEVSGNSFKKINTGIVVSATEEILIKNNRAQDHSRYGVAFFEVDGGEVVGNRCDKNWVGVLLQDASNLLVTNNKGMGNEICDLAVVRGCNIIYSQNDYGEECFIDDGCEEDY